MSPGPRPRLLERSRIHSGGASGGLGGAAHTPPGGGGCERSRIYSGAERGAGGRGCGAAPPGVSRLRGAGGFTPAKRGVRGAAQHPLEEGLPATPADRHPLSGSRRSRNRRVQGSRWPRAVRAGVLVVDFLRPHRPSGAVKLCVVEIVNGCFDFDRVALFAAIERQPRRERSAIARPASSRACRMLGRVAEQESPAPERVRTAAVAASVSPSSRTSRSVSSISGHPLEVLPARSSSSGPTPPATWREGGRGPGDAVGGIATAPPAAQDEEHGWRLLPGGHGGQRRDVVFPDAYKKGGRLVVMTRRRGSRAARSLRMDGR